MSPQPEKKRGNMSASRLCDRVISYTSILSHDQLSLREKGGLDTWTSGPPAPRAAGAARSLSAERLNHLG